MGRSKSKRKPMANPMKRNLGLDTIFNCPFCNHEKSCEVAMDRQKTTAIVSCSNCLEEYRTTKVNYLTEPIDVYSEWIDRCEEINFR